MTSLIRLLLALLFAVSAGINEARAATLSEGLYDNEVGSPLLPVIAASRSTLDIAIYTMSDATVLAALRQALARKVRIRVVKEPQPVGNSCHVFSAPIRGEEPNCPDQRKLRDDIIAAGGEYVPFDKGDFCPKPNSYCFLHGKLVVADGRAALVSTGNFDASNLCDAAGNPSRCNRDFTYLTADPASVRLLESIFDRDLGRKPYDLPSLINGSGTKNVTVSPYSLSPLVSLIQSARSHIRIQNQYLHEPHLNAALLAAAKRGVQVEVIVASPCAFGTPSASEKTLTTQVFQAFDAAGIRSRIFTTSIPVKGHPGYLHAKAISVDDKLGWVGSVNGSDTAFSNNREFGLFFQDRTSLAGLAQRFDADFRSSGTESWQESLRCLKDKSP